VSSWSWAQEGEQEQSRPLPVCHQTWLLAARLRRIKSNSDDVLLFFPSLPPAVFSGRGLARRIQSHHRWAGLPAACVRRLGARLLPRLPELEGVLHRYVCRLGRAYFHPDMRCGSKPFLLPRNWQERRSGRYNHSSFFIFMLLK